MGWRALVVRTRPRLSKMAEPHPWVSIVPGPLPCLYIWHAFGRHAGTLTTPSTRHRLRGYRHHCRGRRGDNPCTRATRPCPTYPVYSTCSETAEADHGHRWGISNTGIPDFVGSN